MVEEINALIKNDTWKLTTFIIGKKTIGCKWVFVVKQKLNRAIERFKMRLVAKDFTQTFGIDYQEIFTPVAKTNSIRVLLFYAINLGSDLQQLDVKNIFLHGDMKEKVYIEISPSFACKRTKRKVCKLKKALIG
jgi:cell division protein ZapA (FtsZ GTPase activity inhibitor)